MIGDSLSNVESLKVSQGFINISSNREIIDGNLSQLVLWINDEKTNSRSLFSFSKKSHFDYSAKINNLFFKITTETGNVHKIFIP